MKSEQTVEAELNPVNQIGIIRPKGKISLISNTVAQSGSTTFTVTPDKGYRIVDVLANGVSVCPVTSYILQNMTADNTV